MDNQQKEKVQRQTTETLASSLVLALFQITIYLCVWKGHMDVEARGELSVCSLLLPCGSQGLDSVPQA